MVTTSSDPAGASDPPLLYIRSCSRTRRSIACSSSAGECCDSMDVSPSRHSLGKGRTVCPGVPTNGCTSISHTGWTAGPIYVARSLEAAGFTVDSRLTRMAGLPVELALGMKL